MDSLKLPCQVSVGYSFRHLLYLWSNERVKFSAKISDSHQTIELEFALRSRGWRFDPVVRYDRAGFQYVLVVYEGILCTLTLTFPEKNRRCWILDLYQEASAPSLPTAPTTGSCGEAWSNRADFSSKGEFCQTGSTPTRHPDLREYGYSWVRGSVGGELVLTNGWP